MDELRLSAFDLNLLTIFEALMVERHLSRAAARINLSQPAMSHALRRLRDRLGDPLFERGAHGLVPTNRALEMYGQVATALSQIRTALGDGAHFDPASSIRQFRIGMSDLISLNLLPQLMPRLLRLAPLSELKVVHLHPHEMPQLLAAGDIELAIGMQSVVPELRSELIGSIEPVCMVARGNPHVRGGRMDLETYVALDHIVCVDKNVGDGMVDRHLATLGLKRRIALRVPYFVVVPYIVAATDMVAQTDAATVRAFGLSEKLAVHPLPMQQPTGQLRLIWDPRHDAAPGHRWLRQLVLEAARAAQIGAAPEGTGCEATLQRSELLSRDPITTFSQAARARKRRRSATAGDAEPRRPAERRI